MGVQMGRHVLVAATATSDRLIGEMFLPLCPIQLWIEEELKEDGETTIFTVEVTSIADAAALQPAPAFRDSFDPSLAKARHKQRPHSTAPTRTTRQKKQQIEINPRG